MESGEAIVAIGIDTAEFEKGVKQVESQMQDLSRELSETSKKGGEDLQEMTSEASESATSLGQIWKQIGGPAITTFAAVGSAIAGIKKVTGDVINSTQKLGDAWQAEMAGLREAYDQFTRQLASGDGWSNLFTNMQQAHDLGVEVARILDEIFERQNSASISESFKQIEIARQSTIMRDTTVSDEARIAAAERVIELNKEIADQNKAIAEQELQAHKMRLQQATGLSDEDLRFFVEQYNLNRDIIQQGVEYNNLLDSRAGKEAYLIEVQKNAWTEGAQTYAKTLEANLADLDRRLEETPDNVKRVADLAKKYDLSNDALVKAYVDSIIRVNNAEAEGIRASQRANTMRASLINEIRSRTKEEVEARVESNEAVAQAQSESNEQLIEQSAEQLAILEQQRRESQYLSELYAALEQAFISTQPMEAATDAMADMENQSERLANALSELQGVLGFVQSALSDLAEGSGNEAISKVAEGADAALDAVSAAFSGAQAGSAFGPWGAAAGAVIGLGTSLYKSISQMHDRAVDRMLSENETALNTLSRDYNRLQSESDAAFGTNKQSAISAMNANLLEQNRILREQIELELQKNNVDENALARYRAALEENTELLRANAEAATDAIFGEDIQSAIASFESAITSAWASGNSAAMGARNFTRNILTQVVSEAIKAYVQASGQIERIRSAVQAAMADSIVTDSEVERLEGLAESLSREVEDRFGWADRLFNQDTRSGITGSVMSASQESVDNVDARLTTMQEHTYSIMEGQRELVQTSGLILQSIRQIEDNTADTVVYLRGMMSDMGSVRSGVSEMISRGVRVR